ncbi:Nitrogen fixation protein VnfA [Candidatus Methylomirabilis lanthanidiphila]|uniref:Nitrogen fixation protein VnfA n=1 Tax=Candidatus Methylomirabilis lanthanidiphila TaxID=2211376 RepID=A0A564ZKL2_9BACT|nr:Nitrogen fixation protein VnfA [Candidatus Methylomirabilis lanthanidiphila]
MLAPNLNTMAGMTVQKEQERHDPKTIRFSALYEAAKILSDQIDLARGLHDVLRLLDACMGMTTSTVCLYDPQRCELTIEAAVGLTDEEQRRGRYRLGEGIVGKVMQSGLPIVVPDIGGQPHVLNKTRACDPQGTVFICLPIKVYGKILGVLSAGGPARDTRASVDADVQVLTIMASLIGHAVWLRREQTHNLHTLDTWKGLRDLERELVMRALKENRGVQARAAARLGITPRQLAYKMHKYRIIKEFRIEG